MYSYFPAVKVCIYSFVVTNVHFVFLLVIKLLNSTGSMNWSKMIMMMKMFLWCQKDYVLRSPILSHIR